MSDLFRPSARTAIGMSFSSFTRRITVAAVISVSWLSTGVRGQDPVEYNRDIRPILADHCFACHGQDADSREADLRLDVRDAAVDAGAFVPEAPDDSELIVRIFSNDPDLVMPPDDTKKPLSEAQKELLKRWIAEGARYETHWAFSAPQPVDPPELTDDDWSVNEIDRFVLARLREVGLSPAPEAPPHVLFRRLHLDITGLPPEAAEADQFIQDYLSRGDEALAEWIDRLMARPQWGEHRARYWLDAARYGDTHGLHFDNYREMWPYRDWVIRSFNRNQPFDEFTIDQLAGDLLPNPTLDQKIATGFQRCNITTNEGGTIDEENLAIYASDRVQTFGWVYMGLTTNCAQCHDHKFDPFTMQDYYSLAAFFRNTTQKPKDGNVADGRGPAIMVPVPEDRDRWEALPGEISAAQKELNSYRTSAESNSDEWLAKLSADSLSESVPTEGLAVHVPLDEGRNQPITVTGAASPAEVSGELRYVKDGPLGAAPIIRSDNSIDVGEAADQQLTGAFSYGAWVRPGKANLQAAVFSRMDVSSAYRGWDLWQNGKAFGTHIIDAWSDNAIKVVSRQDNVRAGEWQHVFVTYDGSGKASGVRIYLDGERQETRADSDSLKPDASLATAVPLRIGRRSSGAVFEGGAVQDIRIYGRVLSETEVSTLAELPAVLTVLRTNAPERTAEQKQLLLDYHLTHNDSRYVELAATLQQLEEERDAIQARSPVTHIQEERADSSAMAHILMRGQYDKPGEQVRAAAPSALNPMPEGAPANRLGLAQWTVDPANPLTARVTVNRFWQEVFGQGIVLTAEDFGTMGTPPTHPELLDWLATDFVRGGWDVKRFFRTVFLSATYRQAALTTPEKLEKDRDNTLLSRGPRFRMDAEMLRDSALAASGLLVDRMFGPGTRPYQPDGIWDVVGLPSGNTRNYVQDKGDNLYRRTIYTFWKRMAPPPNMETFNAPSREVCTVRRERTNTPLQALVTLNDPQFVEAARRLAEIALGEGDSDDSSRIQFCARRLLSRRLNAAELQIAQKSLDALREHYSSDAEAAVLLIQIGDSEPNSELPAAELAAWTLLTNQLMNLDEALCK